MKIPIRTLYALSALYVVIPLLIFSSGWLTLPLAVPCVLGLILFVYKIVFEKKHGTPVQLSVIEVVGLSILTLLWTALSGVGHWGQVGDAYKHNAVLNDLISFSWPVAYHQVKTNELLYLCYYIAYYLPAASVGKLFGWGAAHIFLFVWTALGVGLSVTWLITLPTKINKMRSVLLFIFFGGLDAVGQSIFRHKLINATDWEWWARNWQYSGNSTLLSNVPQHALVGWIIMGMITYALLHKRSLPHLFILFSCVLLWSPFVFLGLIPFMAIYSIQQTNKVHVFEWFAAAALILIQSTFFISNLSLLGGSASSSGWLWQSEKIFGSWALLRLALFYLLEFGIIAGFILYQKKDIGMTSARILLFASLAILLILPWYKMGLYNDLAMRASIPALWVICICWINSLISGKGNRIVKMTMYIVFFLSALYPSVLLWRSVPGFTFPPRHASLSTYKYPLFINQYVASGKSLFFRIAAAQRDNPRLGKLNLK